jgi:putative phosphoribosyl transferase
VPFQRQGASHLFEEPGTLDEVICQTIAWFRNHLLVPASRERSLTDINDKFLDRRDAGRQLANALARFAESEPLILALPRGGVPVAFEVAKALHASLDLLIVRKIGAPGYEEFGLGAVVDGDDPQIVLNMEAMDVVHPPPGYVEAEAQRQFREIERRRRLYLGGRHPTPTKGRTVILVDDGIATGGTMRAALKAMRRTEARCIIAAVPVASANGIEALRQETDEIICLKQPEPLEAIALHYTDFRQTMDEEVVHLLNEAWLQR